MLIYVVLSCLIFIGLVVIISELRNERSLFETHKKDKFGVYRQIVTPFELRCTLLQQKRELDKPEFMSDSDEWYVSSGIDSYLEAYPEESITYENPKFGEILNKSQIRLNTKN